MNDKKTKSPKLNNSRLLMHALTTGAYVFVLILVLAACRNNIDIANIETNNPTYMHDEYISATDIELYIQDEPCEHVSFHIDESYEEVTHTYDATLSSCNSYTAPLPVNALEDTYILQDAACYESQQDFKLDDILSQVYISWQDAYVALLRRYLAFPVGMASEYEAGWYFALHDIDNSGIPELFISMSYYTGHMSYRYIYTFANGKIAPMAFENVMTDGGVLAPLDNSPWIIMFIAFGSGGHYSKLVIEETRIVTYVEGLFFATEESFERDWEMGADSDVDNSYDWHVLSVNGVPVTVDEFESVFGRRNEKLRILFLEITEINMNDLISSHGAH